MKNRILSNILAIGFSALIGSTAAIAQTKHTATIPFNFEAGGTEYAGGTYEIHQLGSLPVVRIANLETRKSSVISAPVPAGSDKGTSPKLVFHLVDGEYSVAEIWLQGAPGMKTYNASKAGRELASVTVAIK